MTLKSMWDCERRNIEKMKKFQLPHYYKKIGIAMLVISFAAIFINRFTVNQPEIKLLSKYCMLVGMLLMSISKEALEDEFITELRMQSYKFAFTIGVIYTLVLPFVDYLGDAVFSPEHSMFKDVGDFQVLWLLLGMQIFYFEYLKRLYK